MDEVVVLIDGVPLSLTVAVPWLAATVIEMVSCWPASLAGPALSLARTKMSTEASSLVVAVSSLATGASLTSVTVTDTVAVALLASRTPLVVPLSVIV